MQKFKKLLVTEAVLTIAGILLLSFVSAIAGTSEQRPEALREYQAATKIVQKKECGLVKATLADYGNQIITLDASEVSRLAFKNTDCAVFPQPTK